MKKIVTLLFILITAVICCSQNNNRVYFTISPEDRKILLPIRLNDSIIAHLFFDTGGFLILDSSFCAAHPSLSLYATEDTAQQIRAGVAWTSWRVHGLYYKTKQPISIGNTNLIYSPIQVFNMKSYFGNDKLNGIFNIPLDDTTHVWECNFEHNYLEIHQVNNFQMPKDCFLLSMSNYGHVTVNITKPSPIQIKEDTVITNGDTLIVVSASSTTTTTISNEDKIIVKFPVQIKYADSDTLTIANSYLIDTGSPWDIALMKGTKEQEFFNNRKDAVWTQESTDYMRHYTVNSKLFNTFNIDSLRIYTFDRQTGIDGQYLIGLNFLKRFNVFFDMKNHQVGLQPIKNFQRLVDPLYRRFHYSTMKTQDGKIIVNKVADYPSNYFKTSGLWEGDEIVAVNGLPYDNYARRFVPVKIQVNDLLQKKAIREDNHIFKEDTLVFDIIRQGKPMKIIVHVDKTEKQGD